MRIKPKRRQKDKSLPETASRHPPETLSHDLFQKGQGLSIKSKVRRREAIQALPVFLRQPRAGQMEISSHSNVDLLGNKL